jgi:predicted TIM-barrel fold metal-dependent hydrolase
MLIDIHTHLGNPDIVAQRYWDGWVEVGALRANRPLEKVRSRLPELWDISGDMIVKDMDAAGIEKSVLLAIDWGLARQLGEPRLSIEEMNKVYADAAEKYPRRLMAFAGIDPRRNKAAELVGGFLKEWDMKGIKIHSAAGFYPNDKVCYPMCEKALEYGVPVLFHTGELLKPMHFKYCRTFLVCPSFWHILADAGTRKQWQSATPLRMFTLIYLDGSRDFATLWNYTEL